MSPPRAPFRSRPDDDNQDGAEPRKRTTRKDRSQMDTRELLLDIGASVAELGEQLGEPPDDSRGRPGYGVRQVVALTKRDLDAIRTDVEKLKGDVTKVLADVELLVSAQGGRPGLRQGGAMAGAAGLGGALVVLAEYLLTRL